MLATTSGYSRLKGVFHAGINYKNYSVITNHMCRTITGNLPEDILKQLIEHTPNAQRGQVIKNIQSGFIDSAKILSDINKFEIQAINRTAYNFENIKQIQNERKNGNFKFWAKDSIYKRKETEAISNAQNALFTKISQILPELRNVIISPLGSGHFANTYKCQFLRTDGQKLFSDKVIKVYRDKLLLLTLYEKIQNFMKTKKFVETMQTGLENKNFSKELNGDAKYCLNNLAVVQRLMNIMKTKGEKIAKILPSLHGAVAEANVAEYIRFHNGHKLKPEDGIVLPDMFGFGDTKFAISEFVSKERKANKKFSFSRIGLQHSDYELNIKNAINGICIDIGGVTPKKDTNHHLDITSKIKNILNIINFWKFI